MPPSRRSLLKLGLGGAALLAAGGLGLGLWPGPVRPTPSGLAVLDPRSYSVLAAVADRICPGGEGLPAASDLDVAALVDSHLARLHPADAAELLQGLVLLENALAGLIFDGRPKPFTACSPEVQDAVLLAWQGSRVTVRRVVFQALRGLIAAAYWGHPDLYAAVGYPGPPDYSGFGLPPAAAEEAPVP